MGCRQGPLGQEDIAQEDLVQDVETAQEMVVSGYGAALGPLMSFVGLSLQAVDLEDLEDDRQGQGHWDRLHKVRDLLIRF